VIRVPDAGSFGAMSISDDGSLLLTGGSQESLRLLSTGNLLYDFQVTVPDDVRAVACHPEEPIIAAAEGYPRTDQANVRIWRLGATAELIQSASLFGVDRLKFTSRGDLIVDDTAGVHLMRPGSASLTELFDGGNTGEASLYPDFAAVKLRNGKTGIWSESSGAYTLAPEAGYAVSRPFGNRQGTFLATLHDAAHKHEAILWQLPAGNEVWRIDLPPLTWLLAVNANGDTVAAADENRLSIFRRGNPLPRSREFNATIRGLFFTDDDASILLILDSTVVKVDAEDLSRSIATSYSNTVQEAGFSPDAKLLAVTTGHDVNIQDIATGQVLSSWTTAAGVNDLCFLANGHQVLTGDSQNRVTVWTWSPEDWVARACRRLTRNLSDLEMQKYLPGDSYRETCPDLTPLSREQLVDKMFPGSD